MQEVERRVTVSGAEADVDQALGLIKDKISEASRPAPSAGNGAAYGQGGGGGSYGQGAGTVIKVPGRKVGLIIGRSGETIRDLQTRSNCRITVGQEHDADPRTGERPLTLSGHPSAVQVARQMIDEIISQGSGSRVLIPRPRPGEVAVIIQVPDSTVGLIIGKGGESTRYIQQTSGTRIHIEGVCPDGSEDRNVHIIGSHENVAYAQQLIWEKVAVNVCDRLDRRLPD